jgi:hypothetical protein
MAFARRPVAAPVAAVSTATGDRFRCSQID